MIAAHVQSHFQRDKDILSFDLKRDFGLLESQRRSTLANRRETHPTHPKTHSSVEITKMILKEVLGAETVDESSNLLLCPDSSAECLLASHDAPDPIGNPTVPLKVGSQGIPMHDNPAMRRSTPDRGLLSQRPSSSLRDQRTRNSDQLSQSEHGTSSSPKNSVLFALASQSRNSRNGLEAQRRVMSMGGFYGLEHGTSNSTRRQRNTTLKHEDAMQQSSWGPSRSPFRSELGTTRNAEWALNSPSSDELSTSASPSRIKAALGLMQEGALPSAKVIRIAALNAASTTIGTPVPPMQVNTTQSCPNGLNNIGMEAVAKDRTTNNSKIRRMLGRSQSLGNRRRPVSCRTPLETIDESKESATFSKPLKSGI